MTMGQVVKADDSDRNPARFRERHYSVADVGEMWNLSPQVIRELFEREPGVLVIGDDGTRSKRRYRTLRIPETVMERVHRRLSNPDLVPVRPSLAYNYSSRDQRLLEATGGP
jgi:hypothetical protein